MICESEDEVEEITIRRIVEIAKELACAESTLVAMEATLSNTRRRIRVLTTRLEIVPKCREIDGGAMTATQKEFMQHSLIPLAKSLGTEKLGQVLNTLDAGLGLDSKLSHTVHHPGTSAFYD
jgi:hypothetical protein